MQELIQETLPALDSDALRREVLEVMERERLSRPETAKLIGLGESTFMAWINGKYGGRNDDKAERVAKWLEARREQAELLTAMPLDPGFQLTTTAQDILTVLSWAKSFSKVGLVVGEPGVGKTTVFDHFGATQPNVWKATLEPCMKGVHSVLVTLCDVMGLPEKRADKLSRTIGRHVAGRKGLIIVDEAQHAKMDALDQLRCFSDLYGVGVVLAGNPTIYGRMRNDDGRVHSQLTSRVGMRQFIPQPRTGDVETIVRAWGISDPAMIKYLQVVAEAGAGALRSVTGTIQLAFLLASGAAQPLALRHLKTAWTRLSYDDKAEQKVARS